VPEEELHPPDVCTFTDEMNGKAVAQHVRAYLLSES